MTVNKSGRQPLALVRIVVNNLGLDVPGDDDRAGQLSDQPHPKTAELNAAENIWQFMRQTYLSNRVFATGTGIVDAACEAWNALLAESGRIKSIATRRWVTECQ